MASVSIYNNDSPPAMLPLAWAMIFAILIHLFLLFAVGIELPQTQGSYSTMEIILVQGAQRVKVDEADYLAQKANLGGGEAEEKVRPATPERAPFPDDVPHVVSAAAPVQQPQAHTQQPAASEEALLAQESASEPMPLAARNLPKESLAPDEAEAMLKPLPPAQQASAIALIVNAKNSLASLQAELDRKFENWAKRPRHQFVGVTAKEDEAALYVDGWIKKIENIGNKNYPVEARRRNISGELTLDVAIAANGTVYDIQIVTSSGYPVLDDAAMRIVRLAAPFPPFLDDMKKEADILHIVRRWQFDSGLHSVSPRLLNPVSGSN